jgi:hypothetical protein
MGTQHVTYDTTKPIFQYHTTFSHIQLFLYQQPVTGNL